MAEHTPHHTRSNAIRIFWIESHLAGIGSADVPSGAVDASTELEDSAVGDGDAVEAKILEYILHVLLALLDHDCLLIERKQVHREPLAALAEGRHGGVGRARHRRILELPLVLLEDALLTLGDRALRVGEDEARSKRHEGAVDVAWVQIIREMHRVHAHMATP